MRRQRRRRRGAETSEHKHCASGCVTSSAHCTSATAAVRPRVLTRQSSRAKQSAPGVELRRTCQLRAAGLAPIQHTLSHLCVPPACFGRLCLFVIDRSEKSLPRDAARPRSHRAVKTLLIYTILCNSRRRMSRRLLCFNAKDERPREK